MRLPPSVGRSPWRALFVAPALALLATACDLEELDAFDDPNPFALRSCAAIDGTYDAIDLRVTSADDPTVLRDFDTLGADWRVSFEDGVFVSRFTEPGRAPDVQTGPFELVQGDLLFTDAPLLTDVDLDGGVVGCSVVGNRLFLRGPATFDFDGDGDLDDAFFEADLDPR